LAVATAAARRHQIAIAERPTSVIIAGMRGARALICGRLRGFRAGFALVLLAAAPAAAQQPNRGLDLTLPSATLPAPPVPSPATSIPSIQPDRPNPDQCGGVQSCDVQLQGGNARRRGMFEMQVPAWRW
jgi:hypothetical protein